MKDNYFLDTNVLIYTVTGDDRKKEIAINLLDSTAVISTQVINECINVMSRKLKFDYSQIRLITGRFMQECQVKILSPRTVSLAIDLAEKYRYTYFDSLLLASALESNCDSLYSEDLQHGQIIEKCLRIINPFII
jgi:predicted nucleic acid-binding protein